VQDVHYLNARCALSECKMCTNICMNVQINNGADIFCVDGWYDLLPSKSLLDLYVCVYTVNIYVCVCVYVMCDTYSAE
jgi:hypothetical protein